MNMRSDFGATTLISSLVSSVRRTRQVLGRVRLHKDNPLLGALRTVVSSLLAVNFLVLVLVREPQYLFAELNAARLPGARLRIGFGVRFAWRYRVCVGVHVAAAGAHGVFVGSLRSQMSFRRASHSPPTVFPAACLWSR